MELFIVEMARYVIILLFALYTFYSFRAFAGHNKQRQNRVFAAQRTLTLLLHTVMSAILIMENKDIMYVGLWAAEFAFYLIFIKVYQACYKGLSKLVLNNMMMCMMVGFVILGRLASDYAVHQIILAAAAMVLCIFVPLIIEKFRILEKMGWYFAAIGIVFLMLVFVIGVEKYGSRNWISVGGIAIQPSEFVKILYVFFMASLLCTKVDFRKVVMATIVAVIHVGILVLSRDLGSAVIFFVTYLVLIYVATRNPGYMLLGLGGGCVGAVVAYHLFGHVRQRVSAWRDPMAVYQNEGYQIVQSLFAIGTGGWFGMGLCQGSPEKIPVVKNDFIFSAICEELGGIFAICLILVCTSFFLMIVTIALKIRNPFYKLIALGLGTEYAFQVFLTIGGGTKFISMTGVTLPLVSYGGSSVMCTILMLAIIQGLYILREDEDEEIESQRKETFERRGKRATPERTGYRQAP